MASELPGIADPAEPVRPLLGGRVDVHVPATSANLGPGFDAFGLGLDYGDDLAVVAVPAGTHERGAFVTVHGEGEGCLPTNGEHLAARTIREAWDAWGVDHSRVDLELVAHNRIPHGRGQGSSAAVVVAALLAAAGLLPEAQRPSRDEVFQAAARLEGHPDNVAPAVYGGFTISWQDGTAFGTAVLGTHPDVVALVAIPDVKLATALARGLLPETVSHADAAANSGRAALLVHALTADPSLLHRATQDLLHESYRAPAMPASAALIAGLRSRGLAATVSGAGPTVLVLATRGEGGDLLAARAALAELTQGGDVAWRVLEPGINADGATVKVHQSMV